MIVSSRDWVYSPVLVLKRHGSSAWMEAWQNVTRTWAQVRMWAELRLFGPLEHTGLKFGCKRRFWTFITQFLFDFSASTPTCSDILTVQLHMTVRNMSQPAGRLNAKQIYVSLRQNVQIVHLSWIHTVPWRLALLLSQFSCNWWIIEVSVLFNCKPYSCCVELEPFTACFYDCIIILM